MISAELSGARQRFRRLLSEVTAAAGPHERTRDLLEMWLAGQAFLDALEGIPGASEEMERRAQLVAERTATGTDWDVARRAAKTELESYSPHRTDRATNPLRKRASTISDARVTRTEMRENLDAVEGVLRLEGDNAPAMSDALQRWRDETCKILSEADRQQVDGWYFLSHWDELRSLLRTPLWVPHAVKSICDAIDALEEFIAAVGVKPPNDRVAENTGYGNDSDDQSETPPGDFRQVEWNGETYSFTPLQAACVKVLWERWKSGHPEASDAAILEAAGSESDRLRDVFRPSTRKHPAWDKMIVQGATKGTHRLAPTEKKPKPH